MPKLNPMPAETGKSPELAKPPAVEPPSQNGSVRPAHWPAEFRSSGAVLICALALGAWLTGALGPPAVGSEIHSAVFLGGLAKVRALLQANPALANEVDPSSGQTPLHYAVQQKRLEIARELLNHGADPNLRDKSGNTPLTAAVAWGGLQEAELLLAHGADINVRDNRGGTLLHAAVRAGNRTTVEFLLSKGASPDATNQVGAFPLDEVLDSLRVSTNAPDIVALLLEHDALHHVMKPGRETLLHRAATRSDATNIITLLLARGADIDVTNAFGGTPLFRAVFSGSTNLTAFLLTHGANPSARSRYHTGSSPLLTAIEQKYRRNLGMVELLLDAGADVNGGDNTGATPLHKALWDSNNELAQLLIERGADVNATNTAGFAPLHVAGIYANHKLGALLLAKGADANARDCERQTPLHRAASSLNLSNQPLVELLLAGGADINAVADSGSPLLMALGHPGVFQFLLARGANPSLPDNTGQTPWHLAAGNHCLDALQLLLEHGAPVGAKNASGETPLHAAAGAGDQQAAELLLSRGANLNAPSDRGTPLHAAVEKNQAVMVKWLLAHGAAPNAHNHERQTPLHLAAKNCSRELVKMLLAKGADINARDHRDMTPMQTAASQGSRGVVAIQMVEYLRQRGGGWYGDEFLDAIYFGKSQQAVKLLGPIRHWCVAGRTSWGRRPCTLRRETAVRRLSPVWFPRARRSKPRTVSA